MSRGDGLGGVAGVTTLESVTWDGVGTSVVVFCYLRGGSHGLPAN